jgi:membrane protease YdiL (CAAX protease family)
MPWDVWLIFFVLAVLVPCRGRLRLRELLAKPTVAPAERLALYASTIIFQWFAVGVAAWRAWAHKFSAGELGLGARDRTPIILVALVGAAIFAVLQWLNLRRMGRLAPNARGRLQALAERVLPQSAREATPFFALAVTAGICEEFLYRGFAIAAFVRVGLPTWLVVVLSSLLFGLAHLYQGRGGFLGTTILGLLFGAARIVFGSLVPVVAWHIAVDVVAGTAGPRYLTHDKGVTSILPN